MHGSKESKLPAERISRTKIQYTNYKASRELGRVKFFAVPNLNTNFLPCNHKANSLWVDSVLELTIFHVQFNLGGIHPSPLNGVFSIHINPDIKPKTIYLRDHPSPFHLNQYLIGFFELDIYYGYFSLNQILLSLSL